MFVLLVTICCLTLIDIMVDIFNMETIANH
jgi:hypothetical protein